MKRPYHVLPILALSLSLLPAAVTAADIRPVVSSQAVLLRDKGQSELYEVPMYSIEGSNYIKLRDLAVLMDSTSVPFECSWNSEREAVELTTGAPYTKTGGEWTALSENPILKESSSNILLNGEPVSLSGYNLNNNNFYKLRDLGQALDVAVYWDHALERVVVSADAASAESETLEAATKAAEPAEEPVLLEPETPAVEEPANVLEPPAEPEAPAGTDVPAEPETPSAVSQGTLANGKEINDENIREILNGLREEYPEGTTWNLGTYYSSEGLQFRGVGCAAFAAMCTDKVWGDNPGTRYEGFESIRVGDILRVKYDSHSVVVLEVLPDSVIVTEGNYQGIVHWDRELSRSYLENGRFFGTTRYPD